MFNIDISTFWEGFKSNGGFFLTAISTIVAIHEWQARVNAEKKHKEDVKEYEIASKLIRQELEKQQLDKAVDQLKEQKDGLDAYIQNEMPSLARQSFAKYGSNLYKEQLIDIYSKYKKLDDEITSLSPDEKLPEDIVKAINGLQNSGKSFNSLAEPIITVIICLVIRDIWIAINPGIPYMDLIPLYYCIKPIIDMISFLNEDLGLKLKKSMPMVEHVFVLFILLSILFFIYYFSAQDIVYIYYGNTSITLLRVFAHVIMVILIPLLITGCFYNTKEAITCLSNLSAEGLSKKIPILFSILSVILFFVGIHIFMISISAHQMLFGGVYGTDYFTLSIAMMFLTVAIVIFGAIIWSHINASRT